MRHAKRLPAAITTAVLIGLALTPAPVHAAPRKPGMRVTLPAATPTPWAPTPTPVVGASARPTTPKAARPLTVVAMPLDLKDPYTAYSLGMIPFASTVAARYVGTRRLSWRIDDDLNGAATRQVIMDWGLLVGGAAVLGLSASMPYGTQGQGAFVGAAAILAIPVSHWLLYAPYWGEQAVSFNRAELTRHGFPLDESVAAPLILAPAE